MPETGAVAYPHRNYNFLVEIDGVAQASFMECSGLDSMTEVIEYREGGDNTTVRKLPGRSSFSDIVLRWGIVDNHELFGWRQTVVDGQPERKNGSIVLFDQANSTEVARWNFVRGWPSKWEGPSLDAKANDVAVEALTITHEGIGKP